MANQYKPINKQRNIELILNVLSEKGSLHIAELYREVMKKQKRKYGRQTSYQVIGRDVKRALGAKLIKVVGGGIRSRVLSLKD